MLLQPNFSKVFSQNQENQDSIYVPKKGLVFTEEKGNKKLKDFSISNQTMAKVDFGLIVRGVFSGELERVFDNLLAIQFGAGVTYFPDYILAFRTDYDFENSIYPDKGSLSYYFGGGLKYYIDTYSSSDKFISLIYRTMNYSNYQGSHGIVDQNQHNLILSTGTMSNISSGYFEFAVGLGFRYYDVLQSEYNGFFGKYELTIEKTPQIFVPFSLKYCFSL